MNFRNVKRHEVVTDLEIFSRWLDAGEAVAPNPAVRHFIREGPAQLTGQVHLAQYDAGTSINPELARRPQEAERASNSQPEAEQHGASGV